LPLRTGACSSLHRSAAPGESLGPTRCVRRAAIYADHILLGAKPSDLPVQIPVKFELVVNLKAAKELGLDVPSSLQQRADEVIE
jgi:putative tryptophan/tyrosine transport system substrate-binding protein